VDHLIFASNVHKLPKKPVEGVFGRELQPFQFDESVPFPLNNRKTASCGSPPRANNKPRGQATRTAANASRANDSSAAANKPVSPSISSHARPQAERASNNNNSPLSGSPPAQTQGRRASTSAACPAYFSSPKPADVPMPTMGFLAKATTTAASVMVAEPAYSTQIGFFPVPVAAA
jgi:hypothetical protein